MQLDATNLFNPKPLMMAMAALSELAEGESLAIMANDGKAVESLVRLAEREGINLTLEDEGDYTTVTLTPSEKISFDSTIEGAAALLDLPGQQLPVVLLTSECLGTDDRELGRELLREVIRGLSEQGVEPQALIFVNSAVRLTCEDELCIQQIDAFGPQTEIFSDSVSMKRFGYEEPKVGSTIDPYQLSQLIVSRPNIVTL